MRARSITVRALTQLTLTFASPAFSGDPYHQKTAFSVTQNVSTIDLRDLLIIAEALICYNWQRLEQSINIHILMQWKLPYILSK